MFDVRLDKFQGPLGILLGMIEDQEMDITEISLASIANQYVDYVQSAEEINPEEVADFLVIAAKLLWLKSKALLPYLSQAEEPEPDELERQLRMYKEFVAASLKIADLVSQKNFLYSPEFSYQTKRRLFDLPLFIPPKNLDSGQMREVMLGLIKRLSLEEKLPEEKISQKISLEDRVVIIRKMIIKQATFNFRSLINKQSSKMEIIVNLLAILELIKQQELDFEQKELFADICLLSKNKDFKQI